MKTFNSKFILKKLKLKDQLLMLIFVSISMAILLELFYYIQTYKLTLRKAEGYMNSTINQVDEKIVSADKLMTDMSFGISYNKYVQDYLVEEDPLTQYRLSLVLENVLTYTNIAGGDFSNIAIVDKNKFPLTRASNGAVSPVIDSLIEKYPLENQSLAKNMFFSEIVKSNVDDNYYFALIRTIFDSTYGAPRQKKVGICMVVLSTEQIQKIVNTVSLKNSSTFVILDSSNNIIAANNKNLIGTKANQNIINILKMGTNTQIKTFANKKSLIQYKYLKDMDWKIVSIIPVKDISDDLLSIRNIGLIIGVLSILMLIMIGAILINSITNPISQIISFMNDIEKSNISKRLVLSETNEVGQLSEHINKMLDGIDHMTKEMVSAQASVYEAKISKKQAQLSALQSQINPHFLYNTLDCMQGYGYLYNCSEIVNITSSLSIILRYSIKGGDIVYIRDEVSCIKNYLNIISIRFGNKHKFNLNIADELMNVKTIKFILQPIIENAIYHGLEPKEEPGILTINGNVVEHNTVLFEIKDDGVGINDEELEIINSNLDNCGENSIVMGTENRSIGLLNVNSRIKDYFGSNYGITIYSKKNEGTTVTIEFPVVDLGM